VGYAGGYAVSRRISRNTRNIFAAPRYQQETGQRDHARHD
jgi:hypothetical protein